MDFRVKRRLSASLAQRLLKLLCAISILVAGLPLKTAFAQVSGGNPVAQLPAPPPGATPPSRANTRIGLATAPTQAGGQIFVTPSSFEIEGVRSIPFGDVAALFAPMTGQAVPLSRLTEAARLVTTMYQLKGYALSFAFIPQQEFVGGVVTVVAVEGYVGEIKIDGDAGPSSARIRALAERIQQDRPLTLQNFERYTQLMAQLPGIKVDARAFPPTKTDGAGSMVVKVSRQQFSASVGTDIRSSRARSVITGVINDPLLDGDRLSVSTLVGALKGESFLAGSYSQLLGQEGLSIKADISQYRGNPDAQLSTPPAILRFSSYRSAELSASYPLILSRRVSLFASGGAYGTDKSDQYANPLNGAVLSEDIRVRAIYLQASYSEVFDERSRGLSARLVQGLQGLGASWTIRTNMPGVILISPAKLDYTRAVFDGYQRNSWDKTWGTGIFFNAQYTPHSLPSSERVSYGSTRFGRAYTPGAIAGDSGWGLGFEGNRSFALDTKYVKRLQPYVLLEQAQVRVKLGTLGFSKLISASLGGRVSDNDHYTLDLALSKPLGEASPDNPARKLRLSMLFNYNFEKR